jgi:CRISPR/Cas system-associated exonuclease Cas4 (RecB family)
MANYTWSYSALNEFIKCPKKYYEIRVAQNFVVIPSDKMIYGTEVHKALEDYVKDGKELALNYLRFKGAVDELIAIPGDKYPEYEMALFKDKTPCAFDDPTRWVRGIVDLLIVDGDYAFIVDYKTGSNRYPDPKQLRLMSLMTFAHFPQVNKIKAGLLFVMHNTFITEEYKREDIEKSWGKFEGPLSRLDKAFETNVWPCNPTPLCGYCPVKTCDYHRG